MNISITGIGSYIPENIVTNESFANSVFYNEDGSLISQPAETIIRKFKAITGIEERRYVSNDLLMSDIASIAARRAIEDAGIDPETLDGIILAHNFGNIPHGKVQTDILPSIASRIKHDLKIKNPDCIAFDILFGCPGWVQGVIIARQYILSGESKRFLVIGAETLSRVLDPHDRDSMIYADGAAATIIEGTNEPDLKGILSTAAQTYAEKEAYYLFYDTSYNKEHAPNTRYIKMEGRKIYEFALTNVPLAMKKCLDKSGVGIDKLKKVFIHQANEKMDDAIIREFYKLYNKEVPKDIMPMSIHKLGNSSVATVPTLLELVLKGKQPEHELEKGDVILLASVGAGMNVNAITYVV
ncbi:3-oxoacyl-ACP synthase [Sphingobacteriaceae bacterium]|nr:3-oxoacyl-ACP synthase [Sphingobacteriaceae bacterium]